MQRKNVVTIFLKTGNTCGYKEKDAVRNAWEAEAKDLDLMENCKFCLVFNFLDQKRFSTFFCDYHLMLGGNKMSYILI